MSLFMIDPVYLVVAGVGLLISGVATARVKWAFAKYSQVPVRSGLTGAEAAQRMLAREGLGDVRIERVSGFLSDHYHPGERAIRLSPDVFDGRSVAAVSVACHEAGHALQHQQKYAPLGLRSFTVPAASIGSKLGPIMCVLGIMLGAPQAVESGQGGLGLFMVQAGLVLFGAVAFFQLVTLPVEFNASARANESMSAHGFLADAEEAAGARSMLSAAAMTYVAALVTTLLWILYYAYRVFGSARR